MTDWIVDICRVCGRKATWPFCEHRDRPPPDGKPWCIGIPVNATSEEGRKLAALRKAQTDD